MHIFHCHLTPPQPPSYRIPALLPAPPAHREGTQPPPCVQCGWLVKRAQGKSLVGRTNWKRRWFTLHRDQLRYYDGSSPGHSGTTLKGTVQVAKVTAVEVRAVQRRSWGLLWSGSVPTHCHGRRRLTTSTGSASSFRLCTRLCCEPLSAPHPLSAVAPPPLDTPCQVRRSHRRRQQEALDRDGAQGRSVQHHGDACAVSPQHLRQRALEVLPPHGAGRDGVHGHVQLHHASSCGSGSRVRGWRCCPAAQPPDHH